MIKFLYKKGELQILPWSESLCFLLLSVPLCLQQLHKVPHYLNTTRSVASWCEIPETYLENRNISRHGTWYRWRRIVLRCEHAELPIQIQIFPKRRHKKVSPGRHIPIVECVNTMICCIGHSNLDGVHNPTLA
jgi:hypothetical protein